MQLAFRPTATLIAAAAVLSATTLAVNPLAPASAEVQRFATQLVNDSALTTVDWATTLHNASENITALQDRFEANPFPDLNAWSGLQSGYAQMISDEVQESLKGVQGIWSGYGPAVGLENLLPQVTEFLQSGDVASAYSLINVDMLFDAQNITQPFFNHIPHGTDEFIQGASGITGDMLRHLAAVSDVLGDYSVLKDLAKAATSPAIGALFQASQSGTEINDLFAAGDTAGAMTALNNLPAQVTDALLNGYSPLGGLHQDDFVGLLTQGSLLDQLLVIIPGKVADALGATAGGTDIIPDVTTEVDPSAAADAFNALLG
ncbi:MAG: hypothetical protein ABI307_07590 [Mycobacterium sp.]